MNNLMKILLFTGVITTSSLYVTNNALNKVSFWQDAYTKSSEQIKKVSKSRDWYKARYEKLKGKNNATSF